jgi:hypothetical protein
MFQDLVDERLTPEEFFFAFKMNHIPQLLSMVIGVVEIDQAFQFLGLNSKTHLV